MTITPFAFNYLNHKPRALSHLLVTLLTLEVVLSLVCLLLSIFT